MAHRPLPRPEFPETQPFPDPPLPGALRALGGSQGGSEASAISTWAGSLDAKSSSLVQAPLQSDGPARREVTPWAPWLG